jgi:hypothetical protein
MGRIRNKHRILNRKTHWWNLLGGEYKYLIPGSTILIEELVAKLVNQVTVFDETLSSGVDYRMTVNFLF